MFLVSRRRVCPVLCVMVVGETIEWISHVSSVRDTRVLSAEGKLVF